MYRLTIYGATHLSIAAVFSPYNFGFSLSASFIILEKISLTRDMWHPLWFLISSECLLYPQSKGYFSIWCFKYLMGQNNHVFLFFVLLLFCFFFFLLCISIVSCLGNRFIQLIMPSSIRYLTAYNALVIEKESVTLRIVV